MEKENWKSLLVSVGISEGVGLISALLTMGGMQDFAQMYKPPFSPPGWLFPIVWTILYLLMGVAAWIVWNIGKINGGKRQKAELALKLYAVQLILNGVWSILFFDLRVYYFSFADLVLLWFFVYLTLKQFASLSKIAARLLLPYLLWITFAGYLNLAIAIHYNF